MDTNLHQEIKIFPQTYLPGLPETRPKAKKSARQMSFIVSFNGLVVASNEGLVIKNENSPLFI